MARNVEFNFRKGGGSSVELMFGAVSLQPTMLHSVGTSAVIPAPSKFDLIAGLATATNVAPSPDPVDGKVAWAYKVVVSDRHGRTFEFLVGVPDGVPPINFVDLPTYTETQAPAFGVGPAGPAGAAATVAVGTVSSGASPAVVNSGTSTNAVLDFTLQQGPVGPAGVGLPAGGTALQYVRKNAGNTTTEWATLDKSSVGLGNVDNTSDADKPVSTATEAAISAMSDGLDANVKVLAEDTGSVLGGFLDGKFMLKDSIVFNVLDHGAKGDGTTNDTEAVRALLLAVPEGSLVCFPNTGNPYMMGKLYAREGTYLYFTPGVVIKRMGATFGVINVNLDNSSPLKDTADPYSGHGNITIDGGIWDGNIIAESYVPGGYNCHHFLAAKNITVKNATVKDVVTNHGIDINGIKHMRVENCKFIGYKDATVEQNRQYTEAVQYGPVSEDPAGSWPWVVYANGSPSRDIVVRDTYFGASGTVGSQAWPTGFGNHSALWAENEAQNGQILLENNTFEGCTYLGVTIYTYNNVKVRDNTFYNCKAGIRANNFTTSQRWDSGTSQFVVAPSRVRNKDQSYINNTFYDSVDFDISVLGTALSGVDGAWDLIEQVVIENNTRVRTVAGRSTGQFIRVIIAKDVQIVGNNGGHSSSGIDVGSVEGVQVLNNKIRNTLGYGIIVSNSSSPGEGLLGIVEAIVTSNQVSQAGSHGIGVNGYVGFTISSNRVYNNARVSSGAGILFSGSDKGLVEGNSVTCTSLPFAVNGIQGSGSTNTNITYDNRVEGTTNKMASFTGSGTVYGDIVYTVV